MKLCGIYAIENKINGYCYIGQSVDIMSRWGVHRRLFRRKKHASSHLQHAWNLYGEGAFIFKILLRCEPSELTYYEQAIVDHRKPEYNIRLECVDSNKGVIHSEETRKKVSESNKGKHFASPEFRKKVSEGNKGKHVLSPEARKKQSESHKGYITPEGTKKKQSDALKGRTVSPEWRRKISESSKVTWRRKRETQISNYSFFQEHIDI